MQACSPITGACSARRLRATAESRSTRRTTRDILDSSVDLVDLGLHRLKDLSEPQRLYQLGTEKFPPLKTLHQTNLRVPLSCATRSPRHWERRAGSRITSPTRSCCSCSITSSTSSTPPPSLALQVGLGEDRARRSAWLAFGPDGQLYVGMGDGGSEGDPQGNGQNPSRPAPT
jgi:hypothetical protein